MNIILFDDSSWENLLPLTFTRPVADVRIGILTIKEKWGKLLNLPCYYKTQDYLSKKFFAEYDDQNILINASFLPTKELVEEILLLESGTAIVQNEIVVAVSLSKKETQQFEAATYVVGEKKELSEQLIKIEYPWDIFTHNGIAIHDDFELITEGRESLPIDPSNRVIAPENIFIEEGAVVQCATLNASTGPIYIGKDAEVMENSVVRGPFALCEHSALKLSAKIYGPTTIGPHSKVGGEVNNSVLFAYSNKGHDGFLGNSVLGEWCNLGADTNNSNLKNNYAEVKLWNYSKERFVKTGLQFCGLVMGDHSKCGINTMFNTGTVVGVSANLFGAGFPRNFVPSFSWGGAQGYMEYTLPKAFQTAEKVLERRDIELSDDDKEILNKVFEDTQKYRKF